MSGFSMFLSLLGLAYGIALIVVTFNDNKFLAALRVDTLVMPSPGRAARWLNFVVGVLLIGYNVYLLAR